MTRVTLQTPNPKQDLALGKDVREVGRKARHPDFVMLWDQVLFFFITLKPRVIQKSMSLKYEPSSEPLHISAK